MWIVELTVEGGKSLYVKPQDEFGVEVTSFIAQAGRYSLNEAQRLAEEYRRELCDGTPLGTVLRFEPEENTMWMVEFINDRGSYFLIHPNYWPLYFSKKMADAHLMPYNEAVAKVEDWRGRKGVPEIVRIRQAPRQLV